MPAIVELKLKPERTSGYVPTTTQLHGLACVLFEGGPGGSGGDAAHDGQEKPFAVWPLVGLGQDWLLRTAWLSHGMPQSVLAACGQVRVGPMPCAVTDLALKPMSFGELASGPPCTVTRVTFRSPTYFSHNGSRVVLPDPRLIVGSWRRRWNASVSTESDLMIPDESWRELNEALLLTEYDLHTERRDNGYGKQVQGFTGTAAIRLDQGTSGEAQHMFAALSRFAEFSGTGAQTTHGFGATSVTVI